MQRRRSTSFLSSIFSAVCRIWVWPLKIFDDNNNKCTDLWCELNMSSKKQRIKYSAMTRNNQEWEWSQFLSSSCLGRLASNRTEKSVSLHQSNKTNAEKRANHGFTIDFIAESKLLLIWSAETVLLPFHKHTPGRAQQIFDVHDV